MGALLGFIAGMVFCAILFKHMIEERDNRIKRQGESIRILMAPWDCPECRSDNLMCVACGLDLNDREERNMSPLENGDPSAPQE